MTSMPSIKASPSISSTINPTKSRMATKIILPITLCLLVLGCSAQQGPWQSRQGGHHQQQCDIQRLTASEPSRRVKSEAGVTEIWDHDTPEFRCTGFVAVRLVIQPGGLLLPSYTNAPYLTFIEQGRGVQGVIVPGCPETFQSELELESESESSSRGQHFRPSERREEDDKGRRSRREEGDEGRRSRRQESEEEEQDQHQKVFRVREGDVIPSPAGVVQWTHNDGDTELISITLIDSNNFHNQLDQNVRSFFLAGQNQESREQGRHHQRQRQEREEEHRGRRSDSDSDQGDEALVGGNVLSGFDDEILRQVFPGVEQETISKIRGENDQRGFIVQARDLKLRLPEESQEEEERQQHRERGQQRRGRRGHGGNGVEDSLCNLRFRHNVDRPAQADIFSPRAGRINTINRNSLPILEYLRLSAQHVTLYKDAIIGPRWNLNAHSALYVRRGEGRAQVVGDKGKTVFDDVLQRGQILVVPQGYAVVVKAGKQGIEWVDVRTNDNAISSPLAGRTSVLRAIPVEVLANAYDISTEQAFRVKTARREVEVFRPFESRKERQMGRIAIV